MAAREAVVRPPARRDRRARPVRSWRAMWSFKGSAALAITLVLVAALAYYSTIPDTNSRALVEGD